jgi:aspartyl-tRNA(Asn)/glutamyl-tRNA(Gln) amidotransferase subunit C
MGIDKALVLHIAELARIQIREEEIENFVREFSKIIQYIDMLKEIPLKEIEPLAHAGELKNILREDKRAQSFPKTKILQNAPQKDKDFFKVPKII